MSSQPTVTIAALDINISQSSQNADTSIRVLVITFHQPDSFDDKVGVLSPYADFYI